MSKFFNDLTTELEAAERERLTACRREWVELVVSVASDRCKLKPKELVEKLNGIGKTIDELKSGVRKYQERVTLAAETKQLEKQLESRKELHMKLRDVVKARDDTMKTFELEVASIQHEISVNDTRQNRIYENRKKLSESSLPEFVSIDRDFANRIQALKHEEENIARQIRVNTNRESFATDEPIEELEARLSAQRQAILEVEQQRNENASQLWDPVSFA